MKFWRRKERVTPVLQTEPPQIPMLARDRALSPAEVEGVKFCSDLVMLKDRAMRLGLYRTMHRIDDALRIAGFEVSGDPQGCDRYEAARAAAERKARA